MDVEELVSLKTIKEFTDNKMFEITSKTGHDDSFRIVTVFNGYEVIEVARIYVAEKNGFQDLHNFISQLFLDLEED